MEDREPIYLWIVKEKAKTALPFSGICRFLLNKCLILHYNNEFLLEKKKGRDLLETLLYNQHERHKAKWR